MILFCKHDWEILSETKTESLVDRMSNYKLSSSEGYDRDDLEQTLIQIVSCKKCGKLQRFVTKF